MSEHDKWQFAGAKRRAAARAVDAVVTVVLAFVAVMVLGVTAGIVSLSVDGLYGDSSTFNMWLALLLPLALVPVAGYEARPVSRRGQTFGKGLAGIRVVRYEDLDAPGGDPRLCDLQQSILRWAIPHLAGVVVGVVSGVVSGPGFGGWAVLVGADAGLAAWMLVYASSLWDPDGRGWHDKAAGTVVVVGAQADPAESGDADRSTPDDGPVPAGRPPGASRPVAAVQRDESSVGSVPGDEGSMAIARAPGAKRRFPTAAGGRVVLIVVAVLVAAVSAGGVGVVGYVAVDALVGSFEIDKYDESVRRREDFGQVVGPDGDACWPDHEHRRNGPVLCDLESIGGLHWGTGDVSIVGTTGRRIFVGSGYMCLLNNELWCWEWSTDVQPPRPARVPQGEDFGANFVTGDGFVCGQTSNRRTVICWTVGVDQRSYQQASRRFDDRPRVTLVGAWDDPPRFGVLQHESDRRVRFKAFTGADP